MFGEALQLSLATRLLYVTLKTVQILRLTLRVAQDEGFLF